MWIALLPTFASAFCNSGSLAIPNPYGLSKKFCLVRNSGTQIIYFAPATYDTVNCKPPTRDVDIWNTPTNYYNTDTCTYVTATNTQSCVFEINTVSALSWL